MLNLKTFPHLNRPLSPLKSHFPPSSFVPVCSPPSVLRRSLALSSSSASAAAAAAVMSPVTTVEHVVLFKVRDSTDPSQIDAMLSNLRSLASLDLVSYLTAGPIIRPRSAAAAAAGFTHLLHSRYRSKPDLAAYSAHPAHQTVVKENVLPICDDAMAVDWVADVDVPAGPPPGSAMRLTLAKPREGAAAAELVAAIAGIKASAPAAVGQLSYGENFSPERNKGYDVGFISVFRGVEELDAMDAGREMVEAQKEKVRPLLESVIVVDYSILPQPSVSL